MSDLCAAQPVLCVPVPRRRYYTRTETLCPGISYGSAQAWAGEAQGDHDG